MWHVSWYFWPVTMRQKPVGIDYMESITAFTYYFYIKKLLKSDNINRLGNKKSSNFVK
jgi:hypothetical protein